MSTLSLPSAENAFLVHHINLLRRSFQHFVGQDLIREAFPLADLGDGSDETIAREIFFAPFILLSHNAAADPIFTYGNQAALDLFEMTWAELTTMPSRLSAEPPKQEERSRLLQTVAAQGYISDYRGIRISKTGRRFVIENVTVWNLEDEEGNYCGQAAAYALTNINQRLKNTY